MSFLFLPLIEDIPSSPDLFENCRINPEVYLKGKWYLIKNLWKMWNAFLNTVNFCETSHMERPSNSIPLFNLDQ